MIERPLDAGNWLNPPESAELRGDRYIVTTKDQSDFWRTTSYGFIHDTGHALLNDFPQDSAVELSWILDYSQQFDQAGLFLFADEENWIKAGIEFADGFPQLGAVVTNSMSDWSVAPVSDWMGGEVHLRVSRSGDAVTVRAKANGDWKLLRLAPLDPEKEWKIGLHASSPTRGRLTVQFTRIAVGSADHTLH